MIEDEDNRDPNYDPNNRKASVSSITSGRATYSRRHPRRSVRRPAPPTWYEEDEDEADDEDESFPDIFPGSRKPPVRNERSRGRSRLERPCRQPARGELITNEGTPPRKELDVKPVTLGAASMNARAFESFALEQETAATVTPESKGKLDEENAEPFPIDEVQNIDKAIFSSPIPTLGAKAAVSIKKKTKQMEQKLSDLLKSAEEQMAEENYSAAIDIYQNAVNVEHSIYHLHCKKLNDANQQTPVSSPTGVFELDLENNNNNNRNVVMQSKLMIRPSLSSYNLKQVTVDANHIISLCSILLKQGAAYLKNKDYSAAIKIYTDARNTLTSFIRIEKEVWDKNRVPSSAVPPSSPSSTSQDSSESQLSLVRDAKSTARITHTHRKNLNTYLAHLWNNVGYAFYMTGQYRQALTSYEESFEVKSKLVKYQQQLERSSRIEDHTEGSNGKTRSTVSFLTELEIGKTLHNIGLVYHATSKFSLAVDSFKEAMHWKNKAVLQVSDLEAPSSAILAVKHQVDVSFVETLLCYASTLSAECMKSSEHIEETVKSLPEMPQPQVSDNDGFSKENIDKVEADLGEMIQKHNAHVKKSREEALQLYQQALSIRQCTLGLHHVDVSVVLYNIGLIQYQLGNYTSSLQALDQAREIRKQHEKYEDSALTGDILHLLGLVYDELTEYDNSITVLEDALRIRSLLSSISSESSLASTPKVKEEVSISSCPSMDHESVEARPNNESVSKFNPNETTVRFHLATAYFHAHQYEKAMSSYLVVMKERVATLGNMHESVGSVISAISDVMMKKSVFDLAIVGYEEALRIQIACVGSYHVRIAELYEKLGTVYMEMNFQGEKSSEDDGKCSQRGRTASGIAEGPLDEGQGQNNDNDISVGYLQTASQIYRINQKYHNLSKTLELIAELYRRLHQDALAMGGYRDALEAELSSGLIIRKDIQQEPAKLLRVANIHNAIGLLEYQNGDYTASKASFSEVLRIKRDILCLSNDNTISTTLVNIGHAHYKMKELSKALAAYGDALFMRQSTICEGGQDLASALDVISVRFESLPSQSPTEEMDELSRNLADIASNLNYVGVVQEDSGDRKEALRTFKLALQIQQILSHAGNNYNEVAVMAEKVGLLQFQSAKYNEALQCFTEALRLKKLKSKGEPTVDIAHTMNSIGNVLYSQRQLDKCMDMYQQALDIKKAILGQDHVDVANTLNNIGNVHHATGDYAEAIHAYTEALNMKRKQLGDEHLDIAATHCNIGDVQFKRQQYNEALEMYEKALRIRKKKLGDTHLDNAAILRNIAKVHQMKGNTVELVKTLEEEVCVRKALLGISHPSLAQPLTNLGRAHHELGQFDKALMSYRESLHLYEQQLKELNSLGSPDRPNLSGSSSITSSTSSTSSGTINQKRKAQSDALGSFSDVLRKIGLVCHDKGEIEKALGAFRASLKYKVRQLGPDSIEVALISENIALCLFNKGDYQGAASSFLEALRVKKLNFGEDSDDVATTLNNLGNVYYTLGELKKAMEAYAKAFLVKKSSLGDDHLDLATMLNNIGSIYAEENEIDEAIETYQEALRIREKRLGGEDLSVASTLINLGDMYLRKVNVQDALDSYNQALRIRSLHLGKQDVEVAFVLDKIANAYAEDGEHKRAVEFYYDAAKVREHVGGKESFDYAVTVEKIALAQIELGKYADAMKCLRHVLNVKKLKLGDNHEEVQMTSRHIGNLQSKVGSVTDLADKTSSKKSVSTKASKSTRSSGYT